MIESLVKDKRKEQRAWLKANDPALYERRLQNRRVYQRARYAADPEKDLAYHRSYFAKHPEKIQRYVLAEEDMQCTWICDKCEEEKKLSEYYANKTAKRGHDRVCKVCRKEEILDRYKRVYPDHPELWLNKTKKWLSRNPGWQQQHQRKKRTEHSARLRALKANLCCQRCGFVHPLCIDFHHIDAATKVADVSLLAKQGAPWKRVLEEIARCEVLCRNCHAVIHWQEPQKLSQPRRELTGSSLYERGRRDKRRAWYRAIKEQQSCARCNLKEPGCLDFHHRDPGTKTFNVSSMVHKCYSEDRILEEIAKCDALCRNCHAILHYEEGRQLTA